MGRAIVLAFAVIACGGSPAVVPWDSGVPEGGRVIYQVDHGYGFCSGSGCPTRIVDVAGTCITETWHGYWSLRESKPCTTSSKPSDRILIGDE